MIASPVGPHHHVEDVSSPLTIERVAGANAVQLQATLRDMRYTLDGTLPSADAGLLLPAYQVPRLVPLRDSLQIIQTAAGGVLEYQLMHTDSFHAQGALAGRDNGVLRMVLSANDTITPVLTLSAGAPTPIWRCSDGQYQESATPTFAAMTAGTEVVITNWAAVRPFVTQIDFRTDALGFDLAALGKLPVLKIAFLFQTSIYGNIGAFAQSALQTHIYVYMVGNLYGNVLSLANMANLILVQADLESGLTGDFGNLPAQMQYIRLRGTRCTGFNAGKFTGIIQLLLHDIGRTTAQQDALINNIWTNRNNFTYAGGITLNIGGANDPVTGKFQDTAPAAPSTPAEKCYQLVNDTLGEGFNLWLITATYTG